MEEFPPLVIQANALARQVGFALTRQEAGQGTAVPSCCLPGVGRLLAVLAASCHEGRIGEIGTGVGVGTAWMASAMPRDCTLVTAEIDENMAAHAARLLASDGRVHVLTGDADELIPPLAPFDLLFADGGRPDLARYSALVGLLRIGGQIVMDDMTPLEAMRAGAPPPTEDGMMPPGATGADGTVPPGAAGDIKRDLFFGDPRLVSTEIVLPDLRNSLLIGTRLA